MREGGGIIAIDTPHSLCSDLERSPRCSPCAGGPFRVDDSSAGLDVERSFANSERRRSSGPCCGSPTPKPRGTCRVAGTSVRTAHVQNSKEPFPSPTPPFCVAVAACQPCARTARQLRPGWRWYLGDRLGDVCRVAGKGRGHEGRMPGAMVRERTAATRCSAPRGSLLHTRARRSSGAMQPVFIIPSCSSASGQGLPGAQLRSARRPPWAAASLGRQRRARDCPGLQKR